MNILKDKREYKISDDIFQKILLEFRNAIFENHKTIKEMNDVDYDYNMKTIKCEELVEIIDSFKDNTVKIKETQNNVLIFYGNPSITIQVLLESIQNCQMINIVIQDMYYAVNKLIVELFIDILKDFRLKNIVSFSKYEGKKEFELETKEIDKIYFIGNKNSYQLLENSINAEVKYIPFDCLDIYCEDEEYDDFARDILEYAIENGYEAEITDEIPVDVAINYLNQYGNGFCSLILSKNKESIDKFKKEIASEYVFANENPFNKKIKLAKIYE